MKDLSPQPPPRRGEGEPTNDPGPISAAVDAERHLTSHDSTAEEAPLPFQGRGWGRGPSFYLHLLKFRAEVVSPLRLPPAAGAALRGALFGTLRQQFCLAGRGPGCGRPELAGSCPVCFLLAPVEVGSVRGQDVPRPYVLRPPLRGPQEYTPGQHFEFELVTFGQALSHFPYALLGIEEMGRQGMGAGRRGAFQLEEVWAENPLAGRAEAVYQRERGRTVHQPMLPVTQDDVNREVERLVAEGGDRRLRLELLSPTRLIEGGKLVKADSFSFRALFARLLERLHALARYGSGPPYVYQPELVRQAANVTVVDRHLQWREVFRASGRHERMLPMSGLVGEVSVEGDLRPFLSYLVWATLTHVGKDADMGNGRVRVLSPES